MIKRNMIQRANFYWVGFTSSVLVFTFIATLLSQLGLREGVVLAVALLLSTLLLTLFYTWDYVKKSREIGIFSKNASTLKVSSTLRKSVTIGWAGVMLLWILVLIGSDLDSYISSPPISATETVSASAGIGGVVIPSAFLSDIVVKHPTENLTELNNLLDQPDAAVLQTELYNLKLPIFFQQESIVFNAGLPLQLVSVDENQTSIFYLMGPLVLQDYGNGLAAVVIYTYPYNIRYENNADPELCHRYYIAGNNNAALIDILEGHRELGLFRLQSVIEACGPSEILSDNLLTLTEIER